MVNDKNAGSISTVNKTFSIGYKKQAIESSENNAKSSKINHFNLSLSLVLKTGDNFLFNQASDLSSFRISNSLIILSLANSFASALK